MTNQAVTTSLPFFIHDKKNPQALRFQQRMNVADVKNQVEQKSFCQTLLGEETDSIKTVIAFMDTHLKALISANKWVHV